MIERAHLHLLAAVQGVEDARTSAARARPDRGLAAVIRRLDEVDTVLRSAVAELSSDLDGDSAAIGGSGVERRALLKLTGTIAGAALTPLAPLEQISHSLERPTKVDAGLLDAHAEVTTTYAEAFYLVPPDQLLAPVRQQLDRLVNLAVNPASPALRVRLESLISDTAAFAGVLAYDLDQPGAARANFSLAVDAARQAGDETLCSLAIALHARLCAQIAPGDRQVSGLLDRAYSLLPHDAPPQARSWLAVHFANDCATIGDELGHSAAIDVARNIAGRSEPLIGGFFSDTGWYRATSEPTWLDENRARGLVALQHRSAEPLLLRVIDDAGDPRIHANALNSLATFYAAHGDVEDACHAAIGTLDLASAHGLPSAVRKTRTTRQLLDGHARNTAVRELDAALAAA